ncbi:MAG: hypothetical protein M3063_10525 [Actinomycetota bacterium]|nr:hypothetical protein [Actinomycetota bacterium]
MSRRAIEELVRAGRFGPTVRLRIDLHGVSSFGPGTHRTLIRWEWIERVVVHNDGVVITSARGEVVFPSGVFGLDPPALAERLEGAGSIFRRADILDELSRTETDP